jgi:peptide/nickel transport system substrate-binding protein
MENRFGIKDLFLFLLIGTLIVIVIVAMRQFDRQYDHVRTIKTQNDQLASEVARIRRQVSDLASGGVTLSAPRTGNADGGAATTRPAASAGGATPGTDAFTHIKAAEQKEGFARGGWMIDNFGTKVGRLTPLISTDVYQKWVQYQVMESLAVRDPYSLEWVPRVARRWDISDDGLTMVFHLRDDVTFSDGHPLTADDVVFSFDWVRNEEVNAPRERAYMTQLKQVRKVNDHTVEFTFTEPYFKNFETAASLDILPKHFYSKFTPSQFNERVGLLLGSGPYMLDNPENWSPGNGVTLIRNPRYWGVPATFDRITFHEIQEEAANMVMYGNQEHDIIRCTPEMYVKLIADSRIMGFSNNFEVVSPYNGYSYIGWNQLRKKDGRDVATPFADKRVRQAMTMLIDRERMAKEIYLGYATVASGPFAPNGPQSDPEVKPWPYDPERAKKMLADAGFQDRDGDGVIESADGKPLRVVLTYPGGQEIYEKIVLFLRDNLARGGVVLEGERLDWPVLVNKLNQGDFDAIVLGWSSVPESDAYQVFHSSQIAGQGDNRTSYRSAEIDKAIDSARKTMDTQQRMQHWNEVHRILHEDQPYTFLFNRPALRLFNKRLHNVESSKVGLNFEYLNGGMIPWYIPNEKQARMQ